MTMVGTLLREIHKLPARHNRLDLAERILRYEKHLQHKHQTLAAPLQQCRERIFDLLDPVNQRPHTAVLCHNDLLRGNRIVSAGKLWAIDWEYCAMGNPWFDLAVVVTGDSLNTAQTEALLLAYLGAAPSDAQRMELTRHSCIYRYMELLWYQAQTRAVLEPPKLNDKMTAMQRALQQYLT